jgi:hypothetical protein
MLFIKAQASVNVPSTEKCSLDNNRLPRLGQHVERGQPLGMAGDAGEPGIDDQARAVLHQPMPDEAEVTQNTSSSDYYQVIDAFKITGSPLRLARMSSLTIGDVASDLNDKME